MFTENEKACFHLGFPSENTLLIYTLNHILQFSQPVPPCKLPLNFTQFPVQRAPQLGQVKVYFPALFSSPACLGIRESNLMRHAGKIFRKCSVKEPLSIRPVCKGTFSLPYKKFSPAWFYEVPRSRFFCRQGKNTQEY